MVVAVYVLAAVPQAASKIGDPPTTRVLTTGTGQVLEVPPLDPLHVHNQDCKPIETEEALPEEQRFVVGADKTFIPLAVPQTPFTGRGKLQETLRPLFFPLQNHK